MEILQIVAGSLPARFLAQDFVVGSSLAASMDGGEILEEKSRAVNQRKGTSNNCHRSSGAPNLPANDSALFSFRFCTVHPKDVRDCQLRQLFEAPYIDTTTNGTFLSPDRVGPVLEAG